jgi:SAM-dependent methyltransferase
MFDPEVVSRPPTDDALAARARKAEKSVTEASAFVATLAGHPLQGRILEVGCYDGATAYQLARKPGTQLVASDLARYYLTQQPGAPSDAEVSRQQTLLAEIRERARIVAGAAAGTVDFVEDDITESALGSASFDAIVSFEVLEHVQRPAAAFAGMARLLRPGGILYHDYNPFFSANGGHSLCTLDFPWGHARLDDEDFERYVREIRPTELHQALRFYRESLNRMTLVDLRTAVTGAGLELLAAVAWSDRALVPRLAPEVLAEVRRSYPTVAVDDLLSTFVAVVARRPVTPDGSAQPLP